MDDNKENIDPEQENVSEEKEENPTPKELPKVNEVSAYWRYPVDIFRYVQAENNYWVFPHDKVEGPTVFFNKFVSDYVNHLPGVGPEKVSLDMLYTSAQTGSLMKAKMVYLGRKDLKYAREHGVTLSKRPLTPEVEAELEQAIYLHFLDCVRLRQFLIGSLNIPIQETPSFRFQNELFDTLESIEENTRVTEINSEEEMLKYMRELKKEEEENKGSVDVTN